MDPLCGWCYGNSENTIKLYEKYKNEFEFEIIPGGMWVGSNVRKQSPQMVNFFLKHDDAVAKTTGIEFGEKYKNLLKKEIDLNSEIPSRAIVTVKKISPDKAFLFTKELQKARYYHGEDINIDAVYRNLIKNLDIDEVKFFDYFYSENAKLETQNEFNKAKKYAQSYPTMLVEKDNQFCIIEQGFSPLENLVESIEKIKNPL